MRHALAAVEPAILLGRPGFLITPCLEVGLAVVGQEHPPGRFKVGARLVERLRRAASAFSRPAIGIEPAVRLGIVRVAGALCNRADVHVTIIDHGLGIGGG